MSVIGTCLSLGAPYVCVAGRIHDEGFACGTAPLRSRAETPSILMCRVWKADGVYFGRQHKPPCPLRLSCGSFRIGANRSDRGRYPATDLSATGVPVSTSQSCSIALVRVLVCGLCLVITYAFWSEPQTGSPSFDSPPRDL